MYRVIKIEDRWRMRQKSDKNKTMSSNLEFELWLNTRKYEKKGSASCIVLGFCGCFIEYPGIY